MSSSAAREWYTSHLWTEGDNCPWCNGDRIVFDRKNGDQVCTQCGVVLQERCIEWGAEWRNFANDDAGGGTHDTKNRCGPGIAEFQSIGQGCLLSSLKIGNVGPGISTHRQSSALKTRMLQRTQQQVTTADLTRTMRQQSQAVTQEDDGGGEAAAAEEDATEAEAASKKSTPLAINASSLRADIADMRVIITGVVAEGISSLALQMYEDFRLRKLSRAPYKRAHMAACVYFASRSLAHAARSLTEACDMFQVNKSHFVKATKDVRGELGKIKEYRTLTHMSRSDTTDTLARILSVLVEEKDRPAVRKRCLAIDTITKKHHVVGSADPEKFNIAIVLLACSELKLPGIDEKALVGFKSVSSNTLARHHRAIQQALLMESKTQVHPTSRKL